MILTILFFILVGFYLFGLLGKLLLTRWIRKKQQEFARGTGEFSRTYTWGRGGAERSKPEGDVTIQQPTSPSKKINKDVGDYVDYEEVK